MNTNDTNDTNDINTNHVNTNDTNDINTNHVNTNDTNDTNESHTVCEMGPFTRIVFSSGAQNMYTMLGILENVIALDRFCIDKVRSIYATSAGSILAVCILLYHDNWSMVTDYFNNCPIQHVFSTCFQENIVTLVDKKGIYGISDIERLLKPLLAAKSIDTNITLDEFFKITNTTLKFYTVDLHGMELVEMTHTTYPDVKLVHAICMSCAIPIMWRPVIYKDMCLIDGALFMNYPVQPCLDELDDDESEASIFGLRTASNYYGNSFITEDTNIFQYASTLIVNYKLAMNRKYNCDKTIPYEVKFDGERISVETIYNTMNHREKRTELYLEGKAIDVSWITKPGIST